MSVEPIKSHDKKVAALGELWRAEAIMLMKEGAPPYAVFESMLASAVSARVKLTGREETAAYLIVLANGVRQMPDSFDAEFATEVLGLSHRAAAQR